MHEFSLRGVYKDEAPIKPSTFYHKNWWTTQRSGRPVCRPTLTPSYRNRFFWDRTLTEVPHCVVFVFDGSHDPFLDEESLLFFQTIFRDCSNHGEPRTVSAVTLVPLGYEPVVVITHLDLVCRDAVQQGRNVQFEIEHKEDKVRTQSATTTRCCP